MTPNPMNCQKCGSPVTPRMKFCESCGAKIETGATCPQCGALLLPNAKFCESCGKPVSPAASGGVPPPAQVPPGTLSGTAEPPAPVVEKVVSANLSPQEPMKTEEGAAPRSEEEHVPIAAKKTEASKKETPQKIPKETEIKKTLSSTPMIIAGIVILVVICAAIYIIVLPMSPGTGANQPARGTSSLPAFPSATAAPAGTQSPASSSETSAGIVSFVTEPTQVPPPNLLVTFQVERDPITGMVIVTFTGGAGQYGIKDVSVRLTRSDGQVITRTLTLSRIGQDTTLQGTKTGDDRIEVTANYYNGDHYKIIDDILVFKKRF